MMILLLIQNLSGAEIIFHGDQHCTAVVVEDWVMKSVATFEAAFDISIPFASVSMMSKFETVIASIGIP